MQQLIILLCYYVFGQRVGRIVLIILAVIFWVVGLFSVFAMGAILLS